MIRQFSTKKIPVAIALILVGLLAGYVLFSNGHDPETTQTIAHEDEHDHENEDEIAYWTCSMHPQIREDGPGEIKEATIDYIDPVMNPDSRTIGVRADIANVGEGFKPEMLVSGRISAKLTEEALMVPATAVLWTGPRYIVYVKDTDAEQPFFEVREVTLGPRSGDFYVIKDGVEEGEEVVYHGTFRVDPETMPGCGEVTEGLDAAP